MIPILCVTGFSGSGKTTLIERLLPELTARGLLVGTLKHDVHGAEPDHEGKDTWRHARAGSHQVALSSPRCVITRRYVAADSEPTELAALFDERTDLVLAEGYSSSDLPKLEVFAPDGGKADARARRSVIATVRAPRPAADLPDFTDDQVPELADFVLRWHESLRRTVEGGQAATAPEVVLCLDGRPLPLKPFLARMLEGIVLGYLASLKWVGAPTRIDLTIRRRT